MIATMLPQHLALKRILDAAEKLLRPKLYRVLNPNVIDAELKLSIHIQNGCLNHIRDYESEPAYVRGLRPKKNNDAEVELAILAVVSTLQHRLEPRLSSGWYGTVGLSIAICRGEATITSDADGVHKP